MVDSNSLPSSSHLCSDQTSLEKEGEEQEYFSETDEVYIGTLIGRELNSRSSPMWIIGDRIMSVRLDSIRWIFNAITLLGFQLHTAYLSVTYFDKFLSRKKMDNEKHWTFRLLSVACLSLAAKMVEREIPSLKDFPMDDYEFESKVIQRMESLVLNTLEWEMNIITPFHYFRFFISKFWKQNQSGNVFTIDLMFAIIKDVNLMNHRPSVVAASATLLALDQKLTMEILETKINECACGGILKTEDVFQCYNRMEELSRDNFKPSQYNFYSNLKPVQLIEADVYGNSSVTPVVNTKRKRLQFTDCVKDCGMPVEKRRH